jgi:hypothetical protein
MALNSNLFGNKAKAFNTIHQLKTINLPYL